MKKCFVIIIVASALTISVSIIRQQAQAQNTSPQSINATSATVTDAVGARTNNPPAPGFGAASQESPPIFVTEIPSGYRDWRLISVAHEEGNLNDIRAILGNDVAIQSYRERKLPFPEGTIIARLAWSYVASEENNKVFGRPQSFVAGHPTNGVYGQGLKKICGGRRLGVRSFQRRQTCRRGVHAKLLYLPPGDQISRPCLHPLRTLAPRKQPLCGHKNSNLENEHENQIVARK